MRIQHKKLVALTVVLGAFITYLFTKKIGPEILLTVISNADTAYLLIAAEIFFASYAFGALGLWHLLDKSPSRGFLLKAHIIGYFLNNITPVAGYGGEIVKAEIIARRTGKSRTKVFAAVIIQKILHLAPSIIFVLTSSLFLAAKNSLGQAGFIVGVTTSVAAALGVMIVIFVSRRPGPSHLVCTVIETTFHFFEKIERRILPSHIFSSACRAVREFHTIAHSMFWKKSVAVPAMLTFLILVCEIATLLFVLLSLGQKMALPAMVLSYSVAVFAGMIPITPGGLGIYDASLAGMLFLFGVPSASAVAAAVLFRLIQYWMTNALGILALARITKS